MGGDPGYGDLQDPPGPYGNASGSAASYPDLLKKAPAPAAKKAAPASAPAVAPSPGKIASDMLTTLAAIYRKKYVVRGKTFGPAVGKKIPVKLVADSDMKSALATQAREVGKEIIKSMLKFNPQKVADQLVAFYKANDEPYPSRLSTIDENTKLTADEEAGLFALMEALILAEVTKDVDQTQGFYALPKGKKDLGTIFVRASLADPKSDRSGLAGTIAHELAHAYAGIRWRDFLRVMFAVGMPRTGPLEEGMATLFEQEVAVDWLMAQPPDTLAPTPGYTSDPEVADSRDRFIADVERERALFAYFGGWIDFGDVDHPQDSILVGKGRGKDWKWPWR